ncbi:MAG: TIGR01777 family oxidoreductase [Acidimicrobiales bacterium]
MDVVITGSSGLIGSALVPALTAAGHRPIRLVRRAPRAGADEIRWMPADGELDTESLEGVDAVVHLAGAGIAAKRWNDAYKRLLLESRTGPTEMLASGLAGLTRPPSVLLSGSAIGFYGDRGDAVMTESSAAGSGFLTDVVKGWEAAATPAADAGIRTTFLRTGIVLSGTGGVLGRLVRLFKLGLGGRLGSGDQYQSWISIDDEVGAIQHLLTADVAGPVNLTAPKPVTNRVFTEELGRALGRPTFLPVPKFGPKLLLGGEMAEELLFYSQRIVPAALESSGYSFLHPEIGAAFEAVLDS